MLTNTSARK